MNDTAKIIHDTIFVKGTDALDILTKTHEFYNKSWDNLVTIMGTIIALVGLAIPVAFYVVQNSSIKIQKRKLQQEIGNELNAAQAELAENIKKELTDQMSEIDLRSKGSTHYLQGVISVTEKAFPSGFINFLQSAYYFASCKDYQNIDICFEHLKYIMQHTNKKSIEDYATQYYPSKITMAGYMDEIIKVDKDRAITTRMLEIKKLYENLK